MSESLSATLEERVGAEEAITAAAAAVEQPLPGFEPPPFDRGDALRKIASANRGVEQALLEYKRRQEAAGFARKEWERQSKSLSTLIADFDEQRRRAEGELVQPSLRPVASGPQSSDCRYSQETGEACPGCILLRKAGAPLPDPDDTEHAEIVRHAFALAEDRPELQAVLNVDRAIDVTRAAVHAWSQDEAREVALWSALNTDLPEDANRIPTPAVLAGPTNGAASAEPSTEQVMEEAKVCLCAAPKRTKKGTCKTCHGAVTGKDTH
jgi:hypothetical protein